MTERVVFKKLNLKDQREILVVNAPSSFEAELAALKTELTALKESKPDVAVVVRSHKELSVQKLIDVMDVVQRAKITKVGVVTTPEQP